MKVLSIASEVYPLVKTGGLADVVGALPAALAGHDISMFTFVPGYPQLIGALQDASPACELGDLFGGPARIIAGHAGSLKLLVLDAPHLFGRPGNPYLGADGKDWPDNAQRFSAFCLAGASIARGAIPGFVPDLIHAHDWQAGLLPALLRYGGGPRSVMTVHNLAFQGHFPASLFPLLELPPEAFSIEGVEYFGGVGFLKAGLQCADALTTVSPSYAQEICTPENGMGLDGLLRSRRSVLHGIINGIDTDVWNPATDKFIPQTYDVRSLQRRAANKRTVEKAFGLEPDDGMLFCVVSRLTEQKGMDLLPAVIPHLAKAGSRLAILGSGDAVLENALDSSVAANIGRIGFTKGYNEPLSHALQAGADAILIPSRFEPCGLTQLYGLHYGCVPVVSRVGGLADTIIDANDAAVAAGVASGIQFSPVDAGALRGAIDHAQALYADQAAWKSMQRNGMKADVTWARSAARYANLYRTLAGA
jgi:starch synthase